MYFIKHTIFRGLYATFLPARFRTYMISKVFTFFKLATNAGSKLFSFLLLLSLFSFWFWLLVFWFPEHCTSSISMFSSGSGSRGPSTCMSTVSSSSTSRVRLCLTLALCCGADGFESGRVCFTLRLRRFLRLGLRPISAGWGSGMVEEEFMAKDSHIKHEMITTLPKMSTYSRFNILSVNPLLIWVESWTE